MSFTIVWTAQDTVFDTWGVEANAQASDLNLGAIYASRQISWEDFLNQIGLAVGLASASPSYKELIAALVLLSMNAPKAKKITDQMTQALQDSFKISEDGYYTVDISKLHALAKPKEVENVLDWFERHEIGNLSDDKKTLVLRTHTVKALKIL